LPAAQDFWAVSVDMDTRLSSSAPVDAVTDRAGAHNWPAMVLKAFLLIRRPTDRDWGREDFGRAWDDLGGKDKSVAIGEDAG
jgi:hypothetical protein